MLNALTYEASKRYTDEQAAKKVDKDKIGAATPTDTQEVHLAEDGKLKTTPGGVTSVNSRKGDVTLTFEDVQDEQHQFVSPQEKTKWSEKQDAGDYATRTELSDGLNTKIAKLPQVGYNSEVDTQEVHIDEKGKLWTAPGGVTSVNQKKGDLTAGDLQTPELFFVTPEDKKKWDGKQPAGTYATVDELNQAIAGLGNLFELKGSVNTFSELPRPGVPGVTPPEIGDVWYVADEQVGYIWLTKPAKTRQLAEDWEQFGLNIDIDQYLKKKEFGPNQNLITNSTDGSITPQPFQTLDIQTFTDGKQETKGTSNEYVDGTTYSGNKKIVEVAARAHKHSISEVENLEASLNSKADDATTKAALKVLTEGVGKAAVKTEVDQKFGQVDTALGEKATKTEMSEGLGKKVDKEPGKGLSANDFTGAYKQKVDNAAVKSEVDESINQINESLGQKASKTELTSGLSSKVDKVDGKGLSTNDFDNAAKEKLAGAASNSNLTAHANNKQNPHGVTAAQLKVPKMPLSENGEVIPGTKGELAVSDGAGGVNWVTKHIYNFTDDGDGNVAIGLKE